MLFIYEEINFSVGEDTFVRSGIDASKTVVFDDNEETGYFYAISRENGMEVLDALHIYDVASVVDKHVPSVLKILWTEDESTVFLSINDYYHAVFDFRNQAGYCRNAFPGPRSPWTEVKERELTDQLIERLIIDRI
ncbi:DUF2251 domain-containing protein [Ravibacter arvi]|uniref:DUF2251 domain-containing protein n=1 Tax=Ravibacter arvi TaxID=2051041 RepID=A0ABP8LWL6_9BACT